MKMVVTQREEITSKKGDRFVIIRGIADNGSTIEAFLSQSQIEDFDVPKGAIATKDQLESLFRELPVVEIEFNQRGRLVSISTEEE